jgi:tRNA threonylcarbamoyladenosine biosynthesis protein TsaB
MRILALDTAGEVGVVAVADGGLLAAIEVRAGARHGETLLAHVERALAASSIGVGDVELIAVGLGPGSFTGVRIGVATAKGLAVARRTPIVGVLTTRVIARGAFGSLRVPVVDAHKGEVFVAAYEEAGGGRLRAKLAETHGPPDAMGRAVRAAIGEAVNPVLAGTGLTIHGDAFTAALGAPFTIAPRAYDAPRGALLALEAEEALAERGADDPASLEPLYVRASDAVLPASAGRAER